LQIDVRMVYLSITVGLRRIMRVVWRHCDCEMISCTLPQTTFFFCQVYFHIELHYVVRVWECSLYMLWKIKLCNFFLQPDHTRATFGLCWLLSLVWTWFNIGFWFNIISLGLSWKQIYHI
jgi:hypothetical protein